MGCGCSSRTSAWGCARRWASFIPMLAGSGSGGRPHADGQLFRAHSPRGTTGGRGHGRPGHRLLPQNARSLDNLELGADFYCFLFSPGGHILSHSLDRYEFPNPQSDLNKLLVQADLRRVVERMHKETKVWRGPSTRCPARRRRSSSPGFPPRAGRS